MDVKRAKDGDNFNEEFIRKRKERKEVWRRHCGGRVLLEYCTATVHCKRSNVQA
jgi:hypothetical protein